MAGFLPRACLALAVAFGAAACAKAPPAPEAYKPGLGEIMTLNQMRHSKLWFAAEARNWPLAAYELDELHEGLDDAVHFHPTHKSSPLPLTQLVPKIMDQPLAELDKAVRARDFDAFTKGYDALTAGCNACHSATNFGFNVVARPTANPFTNQVFKPQ